MTSTLNRLEDGTLNLTLVLPWAEVKLAYDSQVEKAISDTQLPGFRKGKAPKDLVEPKLDQNKVLSQAIQDLLPKTYSAAVTTHNLKPILYPKLELKSGSQGTDWTFIATTCEAPPVTLPDYTTALPKLEHKTGEEQLKPIFDYLFKEAKVQLPAILIEEEANHRLSSLVDNLTQLGMTTDSYLASKKLSAQDLRAQLAQTATADLTLELILRQIQADQQLPDRQKTLDFLTSLV